MRHTYALLWMVLAAAGCALLFGYFALLSGADQSTAYLRNGKSTHHPKVE